MFLPRWLQQFAQRWTPRDQRRRRANRVSTPMRRRVRPRLEILEDRLTPSGDVLVVGATSSSPTFTTNQPSGALVVQLQDGKGHAVAATSNLTVQLSSNSSTGHFLDLSGKALTNSSVTIASGSSFALFEYEDSQAGNPTITLKTSDSSASGQTTFGVHNTLAFTTPIQVLAPNQASGTITIQLQDGKGNAIKAASNMTINLSSSSSTGKFLDTSGKPLSTPSITIAAGSSSVSFKYEDTQSQSFASTIFANSSNLSTSGSQNVYIGAPMVITTPSQTLTAGQVSNPITIQLESAAKSSVTIHLTSSSSGGKFLSSSGNLLPSANGVYSITIAAGASSASFKYQDSQTGSAFIDATNANDSTQSANVVEYIGVPGQSFATIVSPSQVITLNHPSQLITVQLQSNGTPVTTPSNLTLNLNSSSSTGKFLDSSGNPLAKATITIPAGSSSATFEYEDSTAGLPQLTVSQPNGAVFGISQLEDVGGVKLAFSTTARTFSPGQASQPITVQLQDSNGNAIKASSDVTISLSSSANTGGQFLDTTGKPLTNPSITIAAGTSSASFEYESTLGGKQTLTASLQAYGAFNAPPLSATQQETIQAASALAFTTSRQTVTAGQTSGIVTVQLRDSNGNPATAPSGGTTIYLRGASTTFLDTNGNPLPTSNGFAILSIAAGSSSASFKFTTTHAGPDIISASVPAAFSATQTETVNAGSPTALVFQTPAQSLLAGTASGSIVVELTDKYGNAALAGSGGVKVNLSSTSSGGLFLSAGGSPLASPSVTIAAGAGSAIFEYQDTKAGTPTLTAAATGLTSATQKETITSLSGQIHVTNTNDSGSGSLRAAITAADANPGSTIVFDTGVTGAIDLLSALPALTANTNIIGPGANLLTVERSASATTNFGIFVMGVASTQTNPHPTEPAIILSNLTVANGKGTGITNWGTLILQNIVVSNNQAPADTSTSYPFGSAGGIGNAGTLMVLDSTIANNSTTGNAVAAGIDSEGGFVTVINSTITGNVDNNSNSAGGIGIYGGSAYIASSTISGNTATQATQRTGVGSGGGIDASGTVTLYNTIVAGNTGSPNNPTDVSGTFTSLGHNLIGKANNLSSGFVSSDLVGTTTSPINPKLGALSNNGGPTPTMALLTGSPAIGAGSSINAPTTDQRGDARPQQGAIDIGAYELTTVSTSVAPSITGNPTNQSVVLGTNVSFTAAANGSPTPTVQWEISTDGGKTFSNISGATSTTLTLTNVTTAMNGNEYRAVFTNIAGTATTSAAMLSVTAAASAPVLTANPGNQGVLVGHTATFTASASGSPTPTVQWQVSTNGGVTFTDISGATSATLTLNNVPASMNGNQFRAVFSNSAGSVTSTAATLTVYLPPSPPPLVPPVPPAPPAPPVLQIPPLLAFLNSLLGGGIETVNANGTETLTDSLFGISLIVSTFDSSGELMDVTLLGMNITSLFL